MILEEPGAASGQLNRRYTFQLLDFPKLPTYQLYHNRDIPFPTGAGSKPPSPLLLHYAYGVAALKRWGRHNKAMKEYQETVKMNRPAPPVRNSENSQREEQTTARAARVKNRRTDSRLDQGAGAGSSKGGTSGNGITTDEAMNVLRYFYLRTPAAHEAAQRIAEEEREFADGVRDWAEHVTPS